MPRCVISSKECDGCMECEREKIKFIDDYFDDEENINYGNSYMQNMQNKV